MVASEIEWQPRMDRATFQKLCRIAYDNAGIKLRDGKEALVGARVSRRIHDLGLRDARAYAEVIEQDESGQELVHFLDAISTNFTRFFREPEHFEELERFVLCELAAGREQLTIWCAASSSGEEPYSIAMTLLDLRERAPLSFRVLATDISTKVLRKAEAATYGAKGLADVPKPTKLKYFLRQGEGEQCAYSVLPEVKAHVVFERLNLAAPPFPMRGPFDVIFCRNVMIYFDHIVRSALVRECERLLRPGGLLLLGHAETLTGMQHGLSTLKPSVYRK